MTGNSERGKLLLDTHILLWYVEGINLPAASVESIELFRKADNLYLSAISIWEVAMLTGKGKIIFSVALKEWVDKVLSIPGLNIIDLSVPILLESCGLPNYPHKDPADRLIMASSRIVGCRLMTLDEKIIEYGERGYLKIFKE